MFDILNEIEVYKYVGIGNYADLVSQITVGCVFLALILLVLSSVFENIDGLLLRLSFYFVMVALVGLLCFAPLHFIKDNTQNVYDHTEYQVVIHDDTDFLEFTSKYEILDQQGKIYTIREK